LETLGAGRAAQRLQEEAGTGRHRATTLHRLLEYRSRRDRASPDPDAGPATKVRLPALTCGS
jgi:hypothetical protein